MPISCPLLLFLVCITRYAARQKPIQKQAKIKNVGSVRSPAFSRNPTSYYLLAQLVEQHRRRLSFLSLVSFTSFFQARPLAYFFCDFSALLV